MKYDIVCSMGPKVDIGRLTFNKDAWPTGIPCIFVMPNDYSTVFFREVLETVNTVTPLTWNPEDAAAGLDLFFIKVSFSKENISATLDMDNWFCAFTFEDEVSCARAWRLLNP